MRRPHLLLLAIVVVAPLCRADEKPLRMHALDDGLALTPPMGWYPWNAFGEEPQNEKLIRDIAAATGAFPSVGDMC